MNTKKTLVIIGFLAIVILTGCHKRTVLQDDVELYQGAMFTVYQDSYDGRRTSLEFDFNDTISERCITSISLDETMVIDTLEGVSWHVPINVSNLGYGDDLFLLIDTYYQRDSVWWRNLHVWSFSSY